MAKKIDPKADTRELEAEIDQLVYKLYGLTEEEIAVVEGSAKKPVPDAEMTPTKRGRKAKVAEKTGFEGLD